MQYIFRTPRLLTLGISQPGFCHPFHSDATKEDAYSLFCPGPSWDLCIAVITQADGILYDPQTWRWTPACFLFVCPLSSADLAVTRGFTGVRANKCPLIATWKWPFYQENPTFRMEDSVALQLQLPVKMNSFYKCCFQMHLPPILCRQPFLHRTKKHGVQV